MAQKRLQRLYELKKLKRIRESIDKPYYYYTGKKPGQAEHLISLNWVYIWQKQKLTSWEQLHCFEREDTYKVLRADAFCAVKNTIAKTMRFSFVEMDISESGNEFRKVQLYNRLYESEEYSSRWWVPLASGFPKITVVTTGSPAKLQKRIDEENTHGLEWGVYTLDQVKEWCE